MTTLNTYGRKRIDYIQVTLHRLFQYSKDISNKTKKAVKRFQEFLIHLKFIFAFRSNRNAADILQKDDMSPSTYHQTNKPLKPQSFSSARLPCELSILKQLRQMHKFISEQIRSACTAATQTGQQFHSDYYLRSRGLVERQTSSDLVLQVGVVYEGLRNCWRTARCRSCETGTVP